jgi:uncharacterized repeat protein (TIGR01451 family)
MSPQHWSMKRFLPMAGILVVALVLLCPLAALSPAPGLAAQPRPTLTFTPLPSVVPTEQPVQPAAPPPSAASCESICGQVINLGSNAGEPGQTIAFAGAGWSLETGTDDAGNFGYGRLGTDVGLLNLVVPTDSDLHPTVGNIALAPVPGWAIIVNIGVYRGSRVFSPLLLPTLRVEPTSVRPGDRLTYTVQVENRLSSKISGVMVTDLLPTGLSLVAVTSDRGDTVHSGNYGAAFIGDLEPGGQVTVRILADVAADAPVGALRNTVSFIYREHAAAQASVPVSVRQAAAQPAAPTAAPRAAATPASAITTTPQGLPSTGPTFLPSTGIGLTALGAGLALGAAALTARRLRRHRAPKPTGEGES